MTGATCFNLPRRLPFWVGAVLAGAVIGRALERGE